MADQLIMSVDARIRLRMGISYQLEKKLTYYVYTLHGMWYFIYLFVGLHVCSVAIVVTS
jgi:hypothetical protein